MKELRSWERRVWLYGGIIILLVIVSLVIYSRVFLNECSIIFLIIGIFLVISGLSGKDFIRSSWCIV